MPTLIVNGMVAGFVVVAVSELAQRYPRVAEVILAVPLSLTFFVPRAFVTGLALVTATVTTYLWFTA